MRCSLQGLKQLFNTVENVRRYRNPRLKVAGILITRRGNRASLTRELIDVIGQTAKDLNVYLYPTVIREAVAVREAQVMQESLFDSHPKAAVTADYAAFCRGLSQAGGREAWRFKRAGATDAVARLFSVTAAEQAHEAYEAHEVRSEHPVPETHEAHEAYEAPRMPNAQEVYEAHEVERKHRMPETHEAHEAYKAYEERAPKADGAYRAADTQGSGAKRRCA